MAKRDESTTTPRRLRRVLGFAGGFAATALALSFAWTVVGGTLTPEPVLLTAAIVATHASSQLRPLAPPRRAHPGDGSAKHAASPSEFSSVRSRSGTARGIAASGSTARGSVASSDVASEHDSSLLRIESKASRTRGQPEQG